MLTIAQLAPLRKVSQRLYETMVFFVQGVNAGFEQVGVDPKGAFTVTPDIQSLSITNANGFANVSITDNAQSQNQNNPRAISYFIEGATDAGFTNIVHVEHLGPGRNKNIFLGSQTLFFRAYSQLQGSPPSNPVNFGGTTPTAVVLGGAIAAPAQQAYQGSGTSAIGGRGYGIPPRFNRGQDSQL